MNPGDKPVCIEEITANSAMALRSSGGFTLKMTEPLVIMHGKKDKIAPYTLAEEMHSGIKDSRMLTFAGGHLFFFMKERQQFLDAIAEFVRT